MTAVGGIAADQLMSFVQRVEKLLDEKSKISEDIREVYSEAKGNGFDIKTLKKVIKLRALEAHEREEQENLLDLYLRVLGMAPDDNPDEDESKPAERL